MRISEKGGGEGRVFAFADKSEESPTFANLLLVKAILGDC